MFVMHYLNCVFGLVKYILLAQFYTFRVSIYPLAMQLRPCLAFPSKVFTNSNFYNLINLEPHAQIFLYNGSRIFMFLFTLN